MFTRWVAFVFCCCFANAYAADSADAATLRNLAQSRHTLIDGIRQVGKKEGTPISAKFEFEEGKFWLSVYAAKAGITADAEHNRLIELKGAPNAATWTPALEVFEDPAHLTRAAMQLTLLQLSKLDLQALVAKAASGQPGTPYSAIPAVKNGNAVLAVKFALVDGTSRTVDLPL